jgi:hypothetical protein
MVPMDMSVLQIKRLLEKLYTKYNHRAGVPPDPLQFVYRYTKRPDMEIAAFLASALAYGRVRQIARSLTQLFDRMDNAPYAFVSRFDRPRRAKPRSFKHRFTTGDDLSDLLALFRRVFDDYGSLESFFALGLHNDQTISPSTALKVTQAFAQMEPGDPVKYDFALSRLGILENCTGRPGSACESCGIRRICERIRAHLASM